MPAIKPALLILLLCGSTPLAAASDKVPVAVTELGSLGGVEPDQVADLNAKLAVAVGALGRYKALKMDGIRKALAIKGQAVETRCTEEACLARLGKALGLRWLLAGSLMRFGGTYVLKLRIVDARTSLAIASTSNQVKGSEADLAAMLPQAVAGLFASAAPKLHPKTARAQKIKRQRTAAEKESVDEFERMLNKVERDKTDQDRVEKAWRIVFQMAADERLHVEVRRHALRKFLTKFRKNNPYYRPAYEMWQDLEPASLVINTNPAGAMVTINGTAVGNAPLTREVPPGTYRVAAHKEGHTPSRQKVTVVKGQTAALTLLLSQHFETHPYATWGHVTFWSGLGLTAFGGAAMGLSINYASDYKTTGRRADADRSDAWAGLMWFGFGTGVALMTTGIVLWVLEPSAKERMAPETVGLVPSVILGPDGRQAVVTLGGRW